MTVWRDVWSPWPLVGLGAAALCGLLSGQDPVLGVALVIGVGVVAGLVWTPVLLLQVLILSNAVRWADLPLPLMQSVFYGQKALLFAVLVLLLVRRQARWFGAAPLLALSVGAVYTWVLSSPLPGLSVSQTVQSWATLVLAWLAVSVSLSRPEWRRLLGSISWVPVMSVALGVALAGAGLIDGLFSSDATGTPRLAGATIPAYLAAVSACAVVASALLARQDARWALLSAVNVVVLLATSGRGALIFALVALLPYLVAAVASSRRSGGARFFTALAMLAGGVVVLVVFVPVVLARTETSGGLNSSGRVEAWSFFLRLTSDNLLFGRGLGAGPLASAYAPRGVLPDTFVAQHSEYVRLILELGLVGLVLFCLALAATLGRVVIAAGRRGNGAVAASTALGFLIYSGTDNTLTDFQFGVPIGLIFAAMVGLGAHDAPPRRMSPGTTSGARDGSDRRPMRASARGVLPHRDPHPKHLASGS